MKNMIKSRKMALLEARRERKQIGVMLLFGIILSVLLIGLGWVSNNVYESWNNKKQLDGLWMHSFNYSEAKRTAKNMDDSGQWICINVDKTMEFKDIIDTCQHEAGHELFARKCADKPEVCFKLMEELENEK